MSRRVTAAQAPRGARQEILADEDYRAQADFRHALRQFLHISERNARAASITPQQHLLLLAVRGHRSYPQVTIAEIAEHLQLRHNGASLLVERAVQRGLLRRTPDPSDRRRAQVSLTATGSALLTEITLANRAELRTLEEAVAHLGKLMQHLDQG